MCGWKKHIYIKLRALHGQVPRYAACDLVAIVEEARMRQFLNQLLYFFGNQNMEDAQGSAHQQSSLPSYTKRVTPVLQGRNFHL